MSTTDANEDVASDQAAPRGAARSEANANALGCLNHLKPPEAMVLEDQMDHLEVATPKPNAQWV
jgi:hypothetical protein